MKNDPLNGMIAHPLPVTLVASKEPKLKRPSVLDLIQERNELKARVRELFALVASGESEPKGPSVLALIQERNELKARVRELYNELSIAQFQIDCQAQEIRNLEERIPTDAKHPMSLPPAPKKEVLG